MLLSRQFREWKSPLLMATASDNTSPAGQITTIPASELAAMNARVAVGQFTALNSQGRISNLASPAIAAIVSFVMWDAVSNSRVIVWLAFVVFASAVRGIIYYRFSQTKPGRTAITQSTRWAFLTTTCISGLAWGAGVAMIFPETDLALQAFLIVVVLGVGAGATASFGPYFPVLAAFVVPLTIPITAVLMTQATTMHVALGSFGFIFLIVLLLLGLVAHRNFALSFRLEFENAYLALDLEHAQQRLGDAVDSMSEAFAQFDADDRLVVANGRLRQLVPELNQRSNANIDYEGFVRLFAQAGQAGEPPERIDRCVEKFMSRHRSLGDPFEVELANGQWLRVGEQSTGDGGVVAIFSDLTQLKLREAALAESEQRFRDFTRAASDWAWELGADLRFTSVSGRYTDVSGRSPDFLIGKKMADVPSVNLDSDWRAILDAFDRKKPFHNLRLTRPNNKGEPFHFLCSGIPVFSDEGNFMGYRGTGSDITAIVRAEARAHEVQKQMFDAIESIPAGFILFDKDGRLTLWNSRAPEFLPVDRALIRTGTPFIELLRASAASSTIIQANEDEEAWIADRMRWMSESEMSRETRYTDGRFVQILGRRTSDGGIVLIFTDITEIRRGQQELAEKTTLLQATLEGKSVV